VARFAEAFPGLIRNLPHHKPWMIALGCISAVVVLAACGLGSYLLVKDDRQVVGASPATSPPPPKRDISNRTVDPAQLTVAAVFPSAQIHPDPSIPPYKMSGLAQLAKDCRVAATSELGKLLVKLGCNQVVRATFNSPDGGYWVTAGIFNLKDTASAMQAHQQIRVVLDAEKGRFTGYVSGSATKVLGRAPTQLAWDAREHFLVFCVIARADGKEFAPDDPHLRVIIYDLVERYLRDRVIEEWSIDRSAPDTSAPAGPSGAVSGATTPSPVAG
jgi:hypothetical protein